MTTELTKGPAAKAVEKPVFERILNFRDVGKSVNTSIGQKYMNEGLLYRSARLDDATAHDRTQLIEDFKIKTIIDLRTKSEHIKQARQRNVDKRVGGLVRTVDDVAQPTQIPGIRYWNINVNGGAFERALLRRLSFWSFLKLVFLIVIGYRMKAISILGREVMQPRGLAGLGYDSLDYAGKELRQIIEVAADQNNYPLLIHCTQGKDRTGLAVALILFLLAVPTDIVSKDYVLSQKELVSERDNRLREIYEVGLSEEFADTPPEWIDQMKAHLDTKYDGVRPYLRAAGASQDTFEDIENNLLT